MVIGMTSSFFQHSNTPLLQGRIFREYLVTLESPFSWLSSEFFAVVAVYLLSNPVTSFNLQIRNNSPFCFLIHGIP